MMFNNALHNNHDNNNNNISRTIVSEHTRKALTLQSKNSSC